MRERRGGLAAMDEFALARRIAMSAYNAYRYAMHDETNPWDRLPEDRQDGWFRMVFVVKAETEDCVDLKWSDLAKRAWEVYTKAVENAAPWDALTKQHQLAVEAATRHILMVFETEDLTEDMLEQMEAEWLPWADRRLGV